MASEKSIEKDQPVVMELKSDPISKSAEHDVTSGNDATSSDLTSSIAASGDAPSSEKGETDQKSAVDHSTKTPTGFDNYSYPGYNGSFAQVDDNGIFHTDGLQSGMQSDNGSLIYYLPGYDPYATGTIMGVDGQQPYYSSAGYLQHPVSYGSEAMPCYSWDSTYVGDAQDGNAKFGGSTGYAKSNGLNPMKTNGSLTNKFSKSSYTQPTKPISKGPQFGSDFSAGLLKGYHPVGKFSSFSNQKHSLFPHNGQMNYRMNGRLWNGNDRYKSRDRFNRNGEWETSTELTRGPRAQNKAAPLDSSVKKEELGLAVCRDQYNLPDFQIEYENAKFYVIKSYNEDDIHKCIKYDVWASTSNGNKKLDAAFREAEAKAEEAGIKCPVFLFFSVNGSGQFVGLAEMIGQVDFNKDMDFWQLDKWNGFFPVKWHVVKDIPNSQLRHVIIENNENKPVTHSRDTQEIAFKQGIELLKIFKSYPAKTSLLDDFTFYESREKSHLGKRGSKPATLRTEAYQDDNFSKHVNAGDKNSTDATSLINLTKNLSLNACTRKSDAVKDSIENSVPSVVAAP